MKEHRGACCPCALVESNQHAWLQNANHAAMPEGLGIENMLPWTAVNFAESLLIMLLLLLVLMLVLL